MELLLLQDEYTIVGSIFGIIITLIIAVVIYNDAKERGMDPTIYVLLTCICGCCCGGIVYLIAASDHPSHPSTTYQPRPPSGGQPMYGRPQPPPQQGVPPSPPPSYPPAEPHVTNQTYMAPGARICPHCGQPVIPPESKFCSNCGNQVN